MNESVAVLQIVGIATGMTRFLLVGRLLGPPVNFSVLQKCNVQGRPLGARGANSFKTVNALSNCS